MWPGEASVFVHISWLFLTFFSPYPGRTGVWNRLGESSVSCRCCLSFLGQLGSVQPRVLDASSQVPAVPGVGQWRAREWKVSISLWGGVSARSPTCVGGMRQLLEVCFHHFYILVPCCWPRGDWSTRKCLFPGLVSFSILQEANCGCVWEWQLPSALQRRGIRYCSFPSEVQQWELCRVRIGFRAELGHINGLNKENSLEVTTSQILE